MPDNIEAGIVSQLPYHHGDGYGWGGDIIVTFGSQSINLGAGNVLPLARMLAAAPDMLTALHIILPLAKGYADAHNVGSNQKYITLAEEAIAKAEGQ